MDDFLQTSLEKGLEQVVSLGAGYDSRPHHFEARRQEVRVFAVAPLSTPKMNKVCTIFGELPGYVTHAGIEFGREILAERLPRCSCDDSLKTLFTCEGVAMNLSLGAVESTLGFICEYSHAGSQVVFDYIVYALLDETVRHGAAQRLHRAKPILGEGLARSPREGRAQGFPQPRGFIHVTDVPAERPHRRCFSSQNPRPKAAWGYGIVSGKAKR